jgi:hypothetical protein
MYALQVNFGAGAGGDFNTFVVKTPATLAAVSLTINAQSGFVT